MKSFLITYFLFLVFILSFFVSSMLDSHYGLLYLAVARNIDYIRRLDQSLGYLTPAEVYLKQNLTKKGSENVLEIVNLLY